MLREILEELPPRCRTIVKMLHGIDLKTDYTLQEVGLHFNVTHERIRQIYEKAMNLMSHPKNLEKLQQAGMKDVYGISKNIRIEKKREEWRKKMEGMQERWKKENSKVERMVFEKNDDL